MAISIRAGKNELADRENEVAAVVQAVEQGSKLFLVGPPRFGKTSILQTADDRLTKTDHEFPDHKFPQGLAHA